ncbi:MAG TPA: multicopper oxidase family protein [Acidiphilium sp.]
MIEGISRRTLMKGVAATGATGVFARNAHAASPVKRLSAESVTLDVNGRGAKVFRLVDAAGRQGIELAPGERFKVDVANRTTEKTIIHWHGQLPPWTQDGFPWPQTPAFAPGVVESYDYAPIPGTFWMHSHEGLQEQNLMTAPLIVHSAVELAEDRQEIVLMLNDFSFVAPDELLARLTGETPAAVRSMVNQTENVPSPGAGQMMAIPSSGMMGGMQGMSMGGMSGSGMSMGSMGGMTMDLNDIDYAAFLTNDRTLGDPQVVRVEWAGRVRLRIINGASSSEFWIDLGALSGRVVAVDGHPVHPVAGRRFPLAIAQRLDILLDLPSGGAFPVLARLEGSRRRTGIVLATPGAKIPKLVETGLEAAPLVDNSLEIRLAALKPLAPRQPDIRHRIVLSGGMKPYSWALNGQHWPDITPLMLKAGQRVEIELVNHSMMAHPMHLHGHAFQIVAVNGRKIAGAVRDTVLVTPMMGRVTFAFDADNPGRWAFHCHNLYHMMTGMMTEFRYWGIAV